MSTAWFKQNFKPKVIESFSKISKDIHGRKHKKCVEIWHTTCVVRNFGKTKSSRCNVLINPTSPSLLGVKKFSYFPKGGPQPSHPPTKKEHHIMVCISVFENHRSNYSNILIFHHSNAYFSSRAMYDLGVASILMME